MTVHYRGQSKVLHAFTAQAIASAVARPFELMHPMPHDVLSYSVKVHELRIDCSTQLSLFGLEGVTDFYRKQGSFNRCIEAAYLRWVQTQIDGSPLGKGLMAHESMRRKEVARRPAMEGLTHLMNTGSRLSNGSNASDVLVRMLPMLFIQGFSQDIVQSVAQNAARVTHGGDRISEAVTGYVEAAYEVMNGSVDGPMWREVEKFPSIRYFGDGWGASSALKMGVWAFHTAKNYEDLLTKAICHPGDSVSVAAIAGSLWGLAGKKLPGHLIKKLAESDPIIEVVKGYEASLKKQMTGDTSS